MLEELLRWAVPADCAGCGRPDVLACQECLHPLAAAAVRVRPTVRPGGPDAIPVWSVAPYEGAVRELMVAWKDHGRLDLTRRLAPALRTSVLAAVLSSVTASVGTADGHAERPHGGAPLRVVLVPVPSSAAAVRRRGEDVTAELARAVARSPGMTPGRTTVAPTGGPLRRGGTSRSVARAARTGSADHPGGIRVEARPVLRQERGVRDQAGLSAGGRAENLLGRVRVRRSSLRSARRAGTVGRQVREQGALLVVVDDIVTTGASLAAAASALATSGLPVAAAATVAHTPLRRLGTSGPDSLTLRTVGPGPAGLAWTARPDERGGKPRA